MKRYVFILLFVFLFPIISAVEFDMKSDFNQGETLMARVSGNFLDNILFENIFFYRGHVRVPFLYDVAKINNEFYIYALLSQRQDDYSIVIRGVRYMEGSQITDDEIIKNFSVSNQTAEFSIYPGFIIANEDFFIKVQNLQNYKIDIDVASSSFDLKGEEPITLMSGEIKKIYFSIENLTQPTFEIIELSAENLQYEIPVHVFEVEGNGVDGECILDCTGKECGDDGCGGSCGTCIAPETCIKGICVIEKIFRFSPLELDVFIPTNYNKTRAVYLYNLGQDDLEDVSLSISEDLETYVSFSIDKIEELEAGSNIKIKLFLFSEEEIYLDGKIKAETDDETVFLPITLNFLKDYEPLDDEDEYDPSTDDFATTKTCSEKGGVICASDEECSIELVDAKDDKCCLGTCEELKKSSTGKIIGWTIVVVVGIFLIWFFKKKYKGAKKTVDLLKIGKEKK